MQQDISINAISLGTLVRICATLHKVPNDRLPALKGRFRNFLKLGFPDVRGAGTGRRAEYWPEHVALVLVAFELVRFRMPQTAAAMAAGEHSDAILKAVGTAARAALGEEETQVPVLSVMSNALLEDAKRADLADVAIVAVDATVGAAQAGVSTTFVIDAADLVTRAAAAASATDEPFGLGFFAELGR